jgi:hypothetical protein
VSKPEAIEEDIRRYIFSAVPEENSEMCQPWFVRTVVMNGRRISGSGRSTSGVLGGWEIGWKSSVVSIIEQQSTVMT